MPTARSTLGGDPQRLRGVPCVGGRGTIGGAIRGSLPHVDGFREERAAYALAVLCRDDGNGVSPGSDPVEALLEAEAETEGLLCEGGRLNGSSETDSVF